MSKNTTTLPVIADNPLDGTEFNNKFIFRSNEFLNASQGIIEGENPLSSKYRDMTINEQRLFMLTLLKMTPNLLDVGNSNKLILSILVDTLNSYKEDSYAAIGRAA